MENQLHTNEIVQDHLLPSFLIIGAQKAGTSALFKYLSAHPHLLPSSPKEVNYFWQDHYYEKGVDNYAQHFPKRTEEMSERGFLSFEGTPLYLQDSASPARIYDFNPEIKLIVLLRNPIDRAYAQFQMYQRRRQNPLALADSILRYEGLVQQFFMQLKDPGFFCRF